MATQVEDGFAVIGHTLDMEKPTGHIEQVRLDMLDHTFIVGSSGSLSESASRVCQLLA